MAAHTQFPPPNAEAQVRGDSATMIVRFRQNGSDWDISTATWRSYVREMIDGPLVSQCEDFSVVTPDDLPDVFPVTGGTVPCVLVLNWTAEQTALWQSGYVADIEQLSPVKFTPIIFDSIRIDKDVSNEPDSP
jgi:hypothetical protein